MRHLVPGTSPENVEGPWAIEGGRRRGKGESGPGSDVDELEGPYGPGRIWPSDFISLLWSRFLGFDSSGIVTWTLPLGQARKPERPTICAYPGWP